MFVQCNVPVFGDDLEHVGSMTLFSHAEKMCRVETDLDPHQPNDLCFVHIQDIERAIAALKAGSGD